MKIKIILKENIDNTKMKVGDYIAHVSTPTRLLGKIINIKNMRNPYSDEGEIITRITYIKYEPPFRWVKNTYNMHSLNRNTVPEETVVPFQGELPDFKDLSLHVDVDPRDNEITPRKMKLPFQFEF